VQEEGVRLVFLGREEPREEGGNDDEDEADDDAPAVCVHRKLAVPSAGETLGLAGKTLTRSP
jgi:hypothetical protein